MTSILIVDDHEAVRRGIRSLLSARSDWRVCGEATDGVEAVAKAREMRPSVILMDISMPEMDGLAATRILRKELPGTQIVLVSQNDPAIVGLQAKQVNAAAFVPKNQLADALLPTLDQLLENDSGGAKQRRGNSATAAEKATGVPDWLTGGSEMGRLIVEHDWSKTPLGPIERWPWSLKAAVSLMLNSQHPMWIGWGPELTFLYNKAYIQVLSVTKHPWALGRPASEVWAEIWDICRPLADKVLQKGEASFVDEVQLFMNRENLLEETYYSFSYSPIRDESGRVGGLFCPSTEVTSKVVNARQLRTLSELSANAYLKKTAEAACQSAIQTLSKNQDDIPFCAVYLAEREHGRQVLRKCAEHPPAIAGLIPAVVDLDSVEPISSWPLREVAQKRKAQVVAIPGAERFPLGAGGQTLSQALIVPLASGGDERGLGMLILGASPARRLHTEYLTFLELIGGEAAAAIQNARAAEDERQRLEKLAELDRAKTAFFSNVSHEFRTPLTLMLGPLEELLSRSHTDLPPAAKGQLEMVNRNGARLLRLVNTLLDFSRIEAGRVRAVYEETDLAAFTADLASVFRSATERAGLQLVVDCAMREPAYVDRDMWEKIVLNLVSNAFKFTFDGAIRVTLRQADGAAELRVQDTGVGIPAEEMPHLFDRFHRVASSRSRTNEGSGIGLALVQELVKLHGGTVQAESRLGSGTTFVVRVPLGKEHLPEERVGTPRKQSSTAIGASPFVEEALRWLPDAEQSGATEEMPSRYELTAVPCPPIAEQVRNREKILVADDNADMRQYLVRLLSERYDTEAVADGRAALASARQRTPDLILSDVMMPVLDGFGLLRELRADVELRETPFILLSARAGEESRLEGVGSGADDYMVKPFSARELMARVEAHLKMHRLREQAKVKQEQLAREYETLLNQAPIGIYVVDADLRMRHVNPVALPVFGEIPKLIGRDFAEVIHILWPKEAAEETVRAFRHTLETGEPYAVAERSEVRADRGAVEHYEWRIDRIVMPEGGYGVVCYFRDISTQVAAREELRKSQSELEQKVQERTRELWEASEELGELSRRLMRAQDEERRRVARELHDGVGQLVAAISMEIATLAKEKERLSATAASSVEGIQSLTKQLTADMRTMSHLLHPPLLDEIGLESALQEYVAGFAARSGIEVQFEMEPQLDRLKRDSELSLFRIVQECLTNIHRHAESKTAKIRLSRCEQGVRLEVRDQGCGLPAEQKAKLHSGQSAGVGLRGIRERVRHLGGTLQIESDESGTAVLVTLPASGSRGGKPESESGRENAANGTSYAMA